MIYVYTLWRYFNKLVSKYSFFLEKNIFLNDPNILFKYNSFFRLTFPKRLFLIAFYNKSNFKTLNIFIDNIQKIHGVRINHFTKIHNFISKNYESKVFSNENKKRKNSILKEINFNTTSERSHNINDFVNLLIINNIRYTFYFRKLNKNSNLNKHVKSTITYELINTITISGVIDYLSDDWVFSENRKFNKLSNYYNIKSEDLSIEDDEPSWNNDIYKEKIYKFSKSLEKYNKYFLKFTKFRQVSKNENKKDKSKYKIEEYFGDVYIKSLKISKFELNSFFNDFYKSLYSIKYKPTDNSQFLENSKAVSAMFIRKNKIFNKGRYSRNRQLYRTGVYWCLWLNIINVFGLYYYFYRFVFNFGYFYIPMLILILSIFGSRLIKYRLYNLENIVKEFNFFVELFSKFTTEIIKNFLIKFKDLLIKLAVYVFYTILNFFKQK